MPKVIEIYKEVLTLVKVKSYVGKIAKAKACKHLNATMEVVNNHLQSGLSLPNGYVVKEKYIPLEPKDRRNYEKGLLAKAKRYLKKHGNELDEIKGKLLDEYGIDAELFDKKTHQRIPSVARQAFCYLVFTKLKGEIGATFACSVIAAYLGKHRTTVVQSIDAVLDGLEMPYSDYQWIKKVKL